MTDTIRLPILIVEDDEPTRALLEVVLRRSGHPSESAANGRGAIERLRQNDYAAVVLDLMMPEVGGHEVIAFLAADPRAIPVVVCSAAGPRALTGLDEKVVKAVVRKPFDVEEFLAAVMNAVTAS